MPGISYDVPIVGGRTIPELTLIAFAMVYALSFGLGNKAGAIGRAISYMSFVLMFFAVRMNYLLQQVFNISYERGLLYHKLVGTAMMMLIHIHALKEGVSFTGAILGSLMVGAPLVYAFEYFWGKFDWFYYPHVILSVLAIPAAYFHGAPLLSLAILFWLCDVFVRYIIHGKAVTAKATMIGKDLVRLDVPCQDLWSYEAGQYCFLMFSDINRLEYHPFSIASAPSSIQNLATFYIKRNGDWSNRVVDYVQAQLHVSGKVDVRVPMSLEGPYGVLSVDLWNVDVYDTVILVAGGVGITPMTAILPELIYEQFPPSFQSASKNKRRRTRRVFVIWSVRDAALLNDVCHRLFLPTLTQHHFTEHSVVQASETSHLEGSLWTRSLPNTTLKTTSYGSIVSETVPASRHSENTYCDTETDAFLRKGTTAVSQQPKDVSEATYVTSSVHMGVYYAAQDTPESACVARADCLVRGKRPNLTKIFTQIGHQLTLEGPRTSRHRVAVAVCGPSPMVKEIRDFCDFFNPHRDTVGFDCHEEIFRF